MGDVNCHTALPFIFIKNRAAMFKGKTDFLPNPKE